MSYELPNGLNLPEDQLLEFESDSSLDKINSSQVLDDNLLKDNPFNDHLKSTSSIQTHNSRPVHYSSYKYI